MIPFLAVSRNWGREALTVTLWLNALSRLPEGSLNDRLIKIKKG